MEPIKLSVTGSEIQVLSGGAPVAGSVGVPIELEYSGEWEALQKTVVFRANGKTVDCLGTKPVVPWELLKSPGCHLYVGVFGTDGTVQMPTLWGDLGVIMPGADPSGDVSADPTLPIWRQLTEEIEEALHAVLQYQAQVIAGQTVPKPTEAGDSL